MRFLGANGLHYERIAPGRYVTLCDHRTQTHIIRPEPATDKAAGLRLHADGWLEIRAGYIWDGPSGPSIHTASFMRGSLYHDALYDLMRSLTLSLEWREAADKLLRDTCREDGMSAARAAWVYAAVRAFGEQFASGRPSAADRRERRDR